MKKIYLISAIPILALVGVSIIINKSTSSLPRTTLSEKVYVAVEGDSSINVIDPYQNKSVAVIDLRDTENSSTYMPHNVQASPDGTSIWVTANAAMEQHASWIPTAYADEGHNGMNMQMDDQVIVIDPKTDSIYKRIPLGSGQHLSHVVFTPDGKTAVVAAQETDKIYQINTADFEIEDTITLPIGSGPHGLRLSPDGKVAYVAFMGGKALGVVNLEKGSVEVTSLNGSAVQTAVTPDGNYVAVSVYESRSIALYDTTHGALSYVALPQGSEGPVQLYPTKDSHFVYIVDQGVLQNRVANNKLYKLDLEMKTVTESVTVGKAPHGVVVNDDGKRVYVTNLEAGTVSVVDTETNKEITQISVGNKPNGITIWKATH